MVKAPGFKYSKGYNSRWNSIGCNSWKRRTITLRCIGRNKTYGWRKAGRERLEKKEEPETFGVNLLVGKLKRECGGG